MNVKPELNKDKQQKCCDATVLNQSSLAGNPNKNNIETTQL